MCDMSCINVHAECRYRYVYTTYAYMYRMRFYMCDMSCINVAVIRYGMYTTVVYVINEIL
jgi:hypothetical protein